MEIRDILTLARAGYTAEQIELFAKAEQAQPQPMQMAQPQPMQMAQPQPMQMAQPQPMQMAQPVQMAQPQPMQMAQPQPMQMAQPQPMQYSDPVLEQLRVLTGAVQAGNINATQQPAVRGVDDIIGNIINPKE